MDILPKELLGHFMKLLPNMLIYIWQFIPAAIIQCFAALSLPPKIRRAWNWEKHWDLNGIWHSQAMSAGQGIRPQFLPVWEKAH
ncbi:MAG: hypothetical protein BWY58_00772 [Chloroflexi bacterium ADurb.Bin344]|nr:MAG: hypothetical protein BWY58_00772 [Chloroflexi bacterium ADurb.Bin344]